MYSTRQLMIIAFIANENRIVTARDLSDAMNLSIRTIKKEIQEIQSVAIDFGVRITGIRGSGYELAVHDRPLYNDMFSKYLLKAENLNTDVRTNGERLDLIIKKVLGSKRSVSIQELADSLYLNRNTTMTLIKKGLKFLESYHFDVLITQDNRIKLKYDEHDFRLCITEVFDVHYHSYIIDGKRSFSEYFTFDFEKRQEIRQILLRTLRHHKLSMVDVYTQKLSIYLIVMLNRMREKQFVREFSDDEIKGSVYWKISHEISNEIELYENITIPQNERNYLSYLILSYEDISKFNIGSEKIIYFADKAKKYYETAFSDGYRSSLIHLTEFSELIERSFYRILLKNYIGSATYKKNPIRKNPFDFSVSVNYISMKLISLLENELNIKLNRELVESISIDVEVTLKGVRVDYHKQKVIIVSTFGLDYANVVRNFLEEHFSQYIESADVYELYEIRGLDQSNYDYVILDTPEYSFNYDLPYIIVNDKMKSVEMYKMIFNSIILDGYRVDGFLKTIPDQMIFKDLKFENIDQFLQVIPYVLKLDQNTINDVIVELRAQTAYFQYTLDHKEFVYILEEKYSDHNILSKFEVLISGKGLVIHVICIKDIAQLKDIKLASAYIDSLSQIKEKKLETFRLNLDY